MDDLISTQAAQMIGEKDMSDLIRIQVTLRSAFDDSTFTYNAMRRRILLVLSPQESLKVGRIDAFNECAAAVKGMN